MTDHDVQTRIARELTFGERVLWSGRPRQGLVLRPSDAYFIPFSLLWGGFALYWEWSVVTTDAPLLFRLWGIPFVLVGLHMIVGRFFADALQRAKTVYAVTSERVIIAGGIFDTVRSYALSHLGEVSLRIKDDGSGTITLGLPIGGRRNFPPALEGIPNVRFVYETIRQAQRIA